MIHESKPTKFTNLFLFVFIIQYHTEYCYMFRSVRDHHQGMKPQQGSMETT